MASSPFHPSGETAEIVGIGVSTNGRSCEEHEVCGEVLKEDVVVRIRRVQVQVDGQEETALAVYWITDGIDRCRVGFLPKHLVKRSNHYHGRIAQVTEVYSDASESPAKRKLHRRNRGCCLAVFLDTPPEQKLAPRKRNHTETTNNTETGIPK